MSECECSEFELRVADQGLAGMASCPREARRRGTPGEEGEMGEEEREGERKEERTKRRVFFHMLSSQRAPRDMRHHDELYGAKEQSVR